ncbi:ATP synthase F1 subunit epsilon [Clostridium paridis]|uniref:ATP synthase epsilon chain n=1 Tax=Clostridium paridis TaxID=2803863 RepID=A0A937FID8_9CLOT|nr:ATP synthase F1 subunit epsilon [Clostridium paridis]MBL4932673.1 ATP synthase F1 subunit epsilon [Clostridium paridis]
MSTNYTLKIVTPDKIIYEGEASRTLIATNNGSLEMYANHTPIVVVTVPCKTVFYDESGKERELFTSSGVVSFENNQLIFCCDAAEWPEEIDVERAERAKERAENRLDDSEEYDKHRAEVSLQRALIRLSIKK